MKTEKTPTPPSSITFRQRGNSNQYKIIRMVGAAKVVGTGKKNGDVWRVGDRLEERELDEFMDYLDDTMGEASPEITIEGR